MSVAVVDQTYLTCYVIVASTDCEDSCGVCQTVGRVWIVYFPLG